MVSYRYQSANDFRVKLLPNRGLKKKTPFFSYNKIFFSQVSYLDGMYRCFKCEKEFHEYTPRFLLMVSFATYPIYVPVFIWMNIFNLRINASWRLWSPTTRPIIGLLASTMPQSWFSAVRLPNWTNCSMMTQMRINASSQMRLLERTSSDYVRSCRLTM